MDSLVYTPRRSDFIKDGSIFASTSAGTSQLTSHGPIPSAFRPQPQYAPWPQGLHSEQEGAGHNLPTSSPAVGALCYPQTLQAAAASQAELARQIRARFENLVRASPIPQAIQQLRSPQNDRHQPVWQQLQSRSWQEQQASPQQWGTPGARPSTAILNTLLSPVCGKSFTWSVCWAHCKHARCSADHGQSVSCKAILDPRLCQVTAHPNQSTSQLSKPLRLSASQELAPIQNEQHQAAVPKVERLDMLPAAVTSVGVDESDATDRQQDAHSLHQLTQPAVGPLTAVQKTDSIVLKALADQHAHQEQQQQQQQQQLLQEPLQQLQPELAQHEQLQQLASEQLQSEHLQQQQQQHAIRGPRGGQELPDAYDEHDPTGQQVEQQEADSLSSLSPSLQLDIPGFHACLASDASSYHPMHHHCQQGQSDQGHELHALLALPPNAPPQELALPVADADAGQINIKADSSPAKDQRQSHQHQQQQLGLSIALADATEHTTEAGSGCALAEDEQLRCLQQRADGTIVRQASADVMVDIVQDTILETQLADCAADDNAAAAGAGSMVLDELELQKALQALPAVNAAVLSDGHDAPQHVYQQQGHGMLSEDPHSVSHDFEQPHQQHHQQQQQSPTVSDRGAKSTQQHDSAGVSSRPEASKASQQEQQSRQGTELDQAGIDQPQEHLAGGPAQADTADRVVTKQHHPTSDAVPDESAAMASDTEQQQASEQPPQQLPLLNSAQHAPSHSVPHSNNPQHAPSHSLLHSNSAQHAPSHSVPQHSGGSEQYPSVSASKQETSVQHLANCSPAEYRNSVPQQAAADAERSQLDEQGPMQQSTASTEQPSATVSETVRQKRRQPASSSSTAPASKRRCTSLRGVAAGQVQPLLAAPSGVSWQDSKGTYQTSRTGRVRYPPLAFWLSETKVHDKQGGAVAIARPAALPHAKSTKPQPASQTVPDKRHGNRQHTSSEQPAVPSKSTGKPAAAADDVATEAPTQPSTQVTASSPAHTAKARAAAVSPGRVKHKPPAASQPARSAKACLKKQPDAASNDPATQVQQAECAANAGGALPGSMQVPGIDLSAATAAAAACADPFAASAALAAAVATAKGPGAARLRACGICKHCLKPSLRKACLVLKALKEALAGGQTATACHSNEAAQHSKAGKACQRSTAGKAAQSNATAAAEQSDEVSECTQAGTTGKAFNTKAVKSAAAAAAVEGVKGVKTGKAKAASRKRHRQEDTEESECITVPSTSAGDTAEVSQRSQTSSESSDVSEQVQPKRKSLPVKRADGKVSCGTGSVDVAGRKLYKRNKAVLDDPSSDVKLTKHKGQGKRKQAASGQVAAVEARAGIAAGSKVSKGSIPNRKASTSKGPAGGPAKAGASLTGEQPKAAAAGKASRHRARPAATDQGASPVQFLAIEGVEAEEQQAAEALQCLSQSSQGQPHDSHASLQRNQAPAASEQLPKATASSCRNARPMQRSLADVLQHSEPTTVGTMQQHKQPAAEPASTQPQTAPPTRAGPADDDVHVKTEKVSPPKPQLKRLQKGTSAKALALHGPSNPHPAPLSTALPTAAARAGHLASPASPSLAAQNAQSWTAEQKAALQKAFLTVKPSQPQFWLHVANLVPGKTALQCCNAKFDEMPTPLEKPKAKGKMMPGQEGAPIQAPALVLAAGRVKKPTAAATKQFARQVRWQQRAQQQLSDLDSPTPSAADKASSSHRRSNLGKSQSNSSSSTLLTAIQKQHKADKYIDRILRKQGGRLHKVRPVLAAVPAEHAARRDGVPQGKRMNVSNGFLAELGALNRCQPAEEDEYGSEQDDYFSDDNDE